MMRFPTQDGFVPMPNNVSPPYERNNPLIQMVHEVAGIHLAAGRGCYDGGSLQYLFPVRHLNLYGGGGGDTTSDPVKQNNKTDFQKQNISSFELNDFQIIRGYVHAGERDSIGEWAGVFVKLRYRATAGTVLSRAAKFSLGPVIQAAVKIGGASGVVDLQLHAESGWYEVELWSYSAGNLRDVLPPQGQAAFDQKRIVARPDLVKGVKNAFSGPEVTAERDQKNRTGQGWEMLNVAPDHTLHPVRPLMVECVFTHGGNAKDDQGGKPHRLVFGMAFRGWNNYLNSGVSPNPHGGVGFLEFRNLFSHYFFEKKRGDIFGKDVLPELGRDLIPGNYEASTYTSDAHPAGAALKEPKRESFLAVQYMDHHVLQPDCGIGIHRHRDNQEVFLMLSGTGLMLVGDWAHFDDRDRAFELRTMAEGDLTLCKTGQLHALFNDTDRPCSLFMFGGYD